MAVHCVSDEHASVAPFPSIVTVGVPTASLNTIVSVITSPTLASAVLPLFDAIVTVLAVGTFASTIAVPAGFPETDVDAAPPAVSFIVPPFSDMLDTVRSAESVLPDATVYLNTMFVDVEPDWYDAVAAFERVS